MNPEDSSFHLG